jgi:hypothetical protein
MTARFKALMPPLNLITRHLSQKRVAGYMSDVAALLSISKVLQSSEIQTVLQSQSYCLSGPVYLYALYPIPILRFLCGFL